jgi:hypothetical protein
MKLALCVSLILLSAVACRIHNGNGPTEFPVHDVGVLRLACAATRERPRHLAIRYTITNASSGEVSFLRIGLPFSPKRNTELVILLDGERLDTAEAYESDAGLPSLKQLETIVLPPGATYSSQVELSELLHGEPVVGRYDIAGIWTARISAPDTPATTCVGIPLTSFSLN